MADRIWSAREQALKLTDVVGYEVRGEDVELGSVAGTTYDHDQAYLAVDGEAGRRLVQAGRVREIDRDNETVHVAAGDDLPLEAVSLAGDELLGPDFGDPEDRREV